MSLRVLRPLPLLVLCWCAVQTPGIGQSLLKDIWTGPRSPDPRASSPALFTAIGGTVFFSAGDTPHGIELWKSDGTTPGTVLVKDISPGIASSRPAGFVGLGGTVLFVAEQAGLGMELWRTDGTEPGTFLVRDLAPGSVSGLSFAGPLVAVGGSVYFAGDDGSNGVELWRSNGTAGGTTLVRDIHPGTASSSPSFLLGAAGQLFFAADDGQGGTEPWVSDGTTAGTRRVADIWPGSSGSSPNEFQVLGNRIFCSAEEPVAGREIWAINLPALTTQVLDLQTGGNGSDPSGFTSFQGRVYFSADNGVTGRELWWTNGTGVGSFDLQPGSVGSHPSSLAVAGTQMFLTATDAAHGQEPWVLGPTGLPVVLDVHPGTLGSRITTILASPALPFVLFDCQDTLHGMELWRSTGTLAGTSMVLDIWPGPQSSLSFHGLSGAFLGSSLVFAADDGIHGEEPWISSGTSAGTALLGDLNAASHSSWPRGFTSLGHVSCFSAADPLHGDELWRSDGTPAGTILAADIEPGPGSSSPAGLCAVAGNLYFHASTSQSGDELWRSDGTPPGTVLVRDINPGAAPAFASDAQLTALGSKVLFAADDGTSGFELWCHESTTGATGRVVDINPGAASGLDPFLAILVEAASRVFFNADVGTGGPRLWASDGTAGGTLALGIGRVDLSVAAALRNSLWFFVNGALFTSDGSVLGTGPVAGLGPHQQVGRIVSDGQFLYFTAIDAANRQGLWRSDGTAAGTVQLAQVTIRFEWHLLVAAAPQVVFFSADDGIHGHELWCSTPAGTRVLVDANPGPADAVVADHRNFEEYVGRSYRAVGACPRLLYAATDGLSGVELWVSDGTPTGTRRLADAAPGWQSLSPRGLGRAGPTVVFSGWDPTRGHELWAMSLGDPGVAGCLAAGFGSGCRGSNGVPPRIGATGLPALGTAGFRVDLAVARPASAGLLFWYHSPAAIPLPGSCTLYLGQPLYLAAATTNAAGTGAVPLPIPNDPSLLGGQAFLQFAVVDAGGALLGVAALSDALHLLLGR